MEVAINRQFISHFQKRIVVYYFNSYFILVGRMVCRYRNT
jgi:hypothetical protein